MYAQSAPARNDAFAPSMICPSYSGYRSAMSAALENDLVSVLWTLLVTSWLLGDAAMAAETADAYPAVRSAPKID